VSKIDPKDKEIAHLRALLKKQAPKAVAKVRKTKAAKHICRVLIPDSHGAHIDPLARDACLRDIELLRPEEIILLGDHLDCGGVFSSHQRNYTLEMCEDYASDVAACNDLLAQIQRAAPNAEIAYLEGNHEWHVERWVAREFDSYQDAQDLLSVYGPAARLHLRQRGITYYRRSEFYDGLTVPGTIRRGKCYYTHGIAHAKNAADIHLQRFGDNVVFGHIHRSVSVITRSVTSAGYGAWCPGTLARMQPLYRHTEPTAWAHGYAVQFVNTSTQRFAHLQIPIFADGTSGLTALLDSGRVV
jgi:UDP-2,3-diacylglucosamine pyrophosphatase LpxH